MYFRAYFAGGAIVAALSGCGQHTAISPPMAASSAGMTPISGAAGLTGGTAAQPDALAGHAAPATAGSSSGAADSGESAGSDSAGSSGAAAGGGETAGSGGVAGSEQLAQDTATIKLDEFDVPPQSELFMCQDFDNPFGGVDVAVGQSESTMTPGSHHLHVFYGTDAPPAAAAPCENPNEFRPMIHLATIPNELTVYPAGTAAKLKGSVGLRLQAHYVNISDKPLHASVVVKLTTVDPASVTRWVAQMHFNRTALSIKAGSTQSVSTSCTIPKNFGAIGLLFAISHMHRQGIHFVASTSSGVSLLDTTEWDEAPPVNYPQPIMLQPGDAITWTCTYQNPTDQTITYGDSALKNEMCIYIARFFSSPNGDDLECETPVASAMARATKNVAGQ